MASNALQHWNIERCRALDEIVDAHQSVGGSRRGRRFATQQINHAYAMLLSSQFQGFCRDLHSESVAYLIQAITPIGLGSICQRKFTENRKLDKGNPNPGNIGSDYNALGLAFWAEVKALDARNGVRQARLERLNEWRNAIAHQDFSDLPKGSVLRLREITKWRVSCNQLAVAFDRTMRRHIATTTGSNPW